MYVLNPKKYQWVIDIAFGIVIIGPVLLYQLTGIVSSSVLYISVGVSIGYVLHIMQKTLVFSDMLEKAVQEEAREQVQPKAQEVAENTVEETMGIEDEKELENKIDEKAEEVAEEFVEENIE